MRFLYLVLCIPSILLFLDDVRLRRLQRRRDEEDARRTVEALRGTVMVDGVTMPQPSDSRWVVAKVNMQILDALGHSTDEKMELPGLKLGPVLVVSECATRFEASTHINNREMHSVPMRKYANAVWTAYRSRLVQEALNKGDPS